ncbi:MAG: 16S rRNA (guanine(527)-N(7))-methyltransferase RsmG [Candidatus Peribacteraceae bacterium]
MSSTTPAIPRIPEGTLQQLERLNEVFLQENQKLNLSAFRTQENSWIGNVLDSLAMVETGLLAPGPQNPSIPPHAEFAPTPFPSPVTGVEKNNNNEKPQLHILDLGTGGGFPLLPLALCYPQHSFVGMDATQKKIAAVERIAQEMHIPNVSLVTGRAEELGRDPKHREQYDLVLSRAVAPINVLLEYCVPFVKVGGHIVLWKSTKIEQELKDSLLSRAELSCQLETQHEYELSEKWGKRKLVILRKRFATKEKYPREVGVPKKKPLL